jgi:hypothetical protein
MLDNIVQHGLSALVALLADASAASTDEPAEPDLPPSRNRNVSEPMPASR